MQKGRGYHHGNLRQVLMDSAQTLLDEKGALELSMRDLARQAGVSQAAPFRHFENKAALLQALAEEGFERLEQEMNARGSAGEGPEDRLYRLAIAYLRVASERPHFFRMMFSAELGPSRVSEGIFRACDRVYRDLVLALKAGQESKWLKSGDPEKQALVFWATLHGYSMLLIDGRLEEMNLDSAGKQALLRELIEQLFAGLAVSQD